MSERILAIRSSSLTNRVKLIKASTLQVHFPRYPQAAEVTDYVQDDPSSDPIFFADLPDNPPEQTDTQPWTTTSKGQSMMYGRDYLRAQLGI
jgi:hypothetical protein